MTEELPQWTPEISPGTQEVHLLNKDMDHLVCQGTHVVNVGPQVPQMMDVFQDLSIHHSNNGALTKEDHLPEVLKVLILDRRGLFRKAVRSQPRIKRRRPLSCKC